MLTMFYCDYNIGNIVIWKSFSFHFIQKKKKNVPTFPEFGL